MKKALEPIDLPTNYLRVCTNENPAVHCVHCFVRERGERGAQSIPSGVSGVWRTERDLYQPPIQSSRTAGLAHMEESVGHVLLLGI